MLRTAGNTKLTAIGVAALAGATALAGCASGASKAATTTAAVATTASSDLRSVTSEGVGTATAAPDTVTLTIGVETRAVAASAALADNNRRATALIATLKAHGVAAKDVRTAELSVSPTYDSKGAQITGYQVSDTVTAIVHGIAAAGTVIDAAAASAGNAVRVQQISFSIADQTALLAKARADAVTKAKAQALTMAQAAGVTLGPLRFISDVPAASATIQRDAIYNSPAASAAISTPLQAGTQQISVTVDVRYDVG